MSLNCIICIMNIMNLYYFNNITCLIVQKTNNNKMTQTTGQNETSAINIQHIVEQSKKKLQEHKQRMMPLVRFLKKHGLKFKHAICMGTRIQYFRMDNFTQLIQEKQADLEKDPKLLQLVSTVKDDLIFLKRVQNSQKLKYPQNLTRSKTGTGKFAAFSFDTTQSKKIYFIIVLALIIIGVMFPLWPYELKYFLWLLSVALLVIIVTLILIRLILYVILASFGISFWIFPNLFGDYGVIQSLKPLYSVQKWQNDMFNVVLRVVSFALFVYYCHSIYTQPEFYFENFQSAKEVVKDVHDWGVNKIKGQGANFSQRALTMDKILNQTADAFQEKDQYTNFQAPQDIDPQSNRMEPEKNQEEQQL